MGVCALKKVLGGVRVFARTLSMCVCYGVCVYLCVLVVNIFLTVRGGGR